MGKYRDVITLIVSIVVSQIAGVIGGIATTSSVRTWYLLLRKPSFNPPAWLFGPVWTVLYTLMGIAAWLVWRQGSERPAVRAGLLLFAVQLGLNAAWSVIFFGLRSPQFAFFELLILLAAIVATMVLFFRVSVAAGLLLIPYLLWVIFAGVLNYSVWTLNR